MMTEPSSNTAGLILPAFYVKYVSTASEVTNSAKSSLLPVATSDAAPYMGSKAFSSFPRPQSSMDFIFPDLHFPGRVGVGLNMIIGYAIIPLRNKCNTPQPHATVSY